MDTSELKNITNLVIIADTHFGSRSAVCPPRVYWDKGAYSYNKVQRKLWQYWRYFHDVWVPEATRGEKFLYVHVGDVIDGDHHETTDNISNNIAAQFAIADTVLSPLLENKKCIGMLLLRGTDAHDGKDGQDAETVGRLIGTVHSDDKHEQYSHPEAYVKCGKGLVHFKHTVGRGQGASEFTAVHKVYLSMLTNAARWGRPIPTYVVRAHQHVYRAPNSAIEGGTGGGIVCPCWQSMTPFGHRCVIDEPPMFGGIVIRQGSRDLYMCEKVWSVDKPKIIGG